MIDGKYNLSLELPIGSVDAKVDVKTEGDVAHFEFDAPLIGKRSLDGTCDGDTFTAEGALKLKLLGNIEFAVEGEVEGDDMYILAKTNKGEFKLHGLRA